MPAKESQDTELRTSQEIEEEITDLSNDKEAIRDRQRVLHGELAEALNREAAERDAAKSDEERALDQPPSSPADRRN
jgi:hypothetical protein